MARITNINNEYMPSMLSYLEHLESGGADLLIVNSSINNIVNDIFSNNELMSTAFLGGMMAWALGIFVGQCIKYIARLKA